MVKEYSCKKQSCLSGAFQRLEITISRGEGCWIYDSSGNKYLDMVGGIACCPLGHSNPRVSEAIELQAGKILNASNLVSSECQEELADLLTKISGLEKCFFSNSGTEANEAALKLAMSATGRSGVIACEGSFHGRTLGSLALTYPQKYKEKFKARLAYTDFVPFGDPDAIAHKMDKDTAAVFLEPILGEGGIIVPPADYLKKALKLCEENGSMLVLDEVQTGNGRTGTYFEYMHYDILPHIVTTAKGLANGLPIGATIYRGVDFLPGEHGSTFGGNSFVTSVACEVVKTIKNEGLEKNAQLVGGHIIDAINAMGHSKVKEVRGKGLMIGIELFEDAEKIQKKLLENGVFVSVVQKKVIRLLPPLTLSIEEADGFIKKFSEAME